MRDFSRLDALMDRLAGDVYPEPPAEPHLRITEMVISHFCRDGIIASGKRVLDVGCGQGIALQRFTDLGMDAVGITLGPDFEICRNKGLKVRQMDQSFLEFDDEEFDFLWCRHVLEHSIFPLFTLTEYSRVVKPGGHIYVEVPAPDTPCAHQANPNHYSVLGESMWVRLFEKVGLSVIQSFALNFAVPAGPDVYWAFLLTKSPANSSNL